MAFSSKLFRGTFPKATSSLEGQRAALQKAFQMCVCVLQIPCTYSIHGELPPRSLLVSSLEHLGSEPCLASASRSKAEKHVLVIEVCRRENTTVGGRRTIGSSEQNMMVVRPK